MTTNDELPAMFQKIASQKFETATTPKSEKLDAGAASVISDLSEKYPTWAMADVTKLKLLHNDAVSISGPARDKFVREDLYRVAHDIKGQGATFDYPLMTDVAAALCNFIKKQETFDANAMKYIKECTDDLELILNKKLKGDGGDLGTQILSKIKANPQ